MTFARLWPPEFTSLLRPWALGMGQNCRHQLSRHLLARQTLPALAEYRRASPFPGALHPRQGHRPRARQTSVTRGYIQSRPSDAVQYVPKEDIEQPGLDQPHLRDRGAAKTAAESLRYAFRGGQSCFHYLTDLAYRMPHRDPCLGIDKDEPRSAHLVISRHDPPGPLPAKG